MYPIKRSRQLALLVLTVASDGWTEQSRRTVSAKLPALVSVGPSRLFNMCALWLEEASFQKGDTYIPSLPKQYDAHRLAKIMQNQQVK